MKILIVDDETPVRDFCSRTLRGEYEISTSQSADEAANCLDQGWDIILSDISMPGSMNGIELLRRAKQTGNADVVMMTANAELDFAIQALKLGAFDFILKPFSPDVLKSAIRRCADKRTLSAELAREKALRAELERTHQELRRMQQVKETFGMFVTPEVVSHVLTLPPDQWKKGVRKTVTILFADVRRFTPFAGSLPPETVVETLNEIFHRIVEPVQRHGGVLNKFMGDGILALFGTPVDMKDHASAAARAALEARDAIEDLASSNRSSGRPPLRIGIGVNTGEVVAGCLGTQNRTEYSVIGHTVNMAARLVGTAEPGQILLGPETGRILDEGFRRKKIGPLHLRGIEGEVFVSELVGKN